MDESDFRLENYSYHLPDSLVAQEPAPERDASRLMHLDRATGRVSHLSFRDITRFFREGDLLVLNSSRVFPARLEGRKATGGKAEVFLLHFPDIRGDGSAVARALSRSSKPLRPGMEIYFSGQLRARVLERLGNGEVKVELLFSGDLEEVLAKEGRMPLPPYINRHERADDRSRYQTVYARETGSVAAPTAGLHFTDKILDSIREKGAAIAFVTLHVGYGTFAPVRTGDIREHNIHEEFVTVPEATAEAVAKCRAAGGRVWAAGTTSVRSLEHFARDDGMVRAGRGGCRLYITPGYRFRAVDCMITNFHLPESSLVILVSAFAGRETVLAAYRKAVEERYRFYSSGDAMVIT